MNDEKDFFEATRIRIMEALATYQPEINSDFSEKSIFNLVRNGKEPQKKGHHQSSVIKGTRNAAISKLNCSDDVFEHLKIQRVINNLPIDINNWLLYRYADSPSLNHVPALLNALMERLPLEKCRKPTQKKVLSILVLRLVKRDFLDCLHRTYFEAVGIKKQTYYECYAKHNDNITLLFDSFDRLALCEFYERYMAQNCINKAAG